MHVRKHRISPILAGLAIALGVARAPAAAPPVLAGTTKLVTNVGTSGIVVSLPRTITVDLANLSGSVQRSGPGHFGGVVIDGIRQSPQSRVGLAYVRFAPPFGCSLDGRCVPVDALAVRAPGSATYAKPASSTLTLPAGIYRVYMVAPFSSRTQAIQLKLPGLGGSTVIRPDAVTHGWQLGNSYVGLDDGSLDEHPENVLYKRGETTDPTWHPIDAGGVNVSVAAGTILLGGVWTSPGSSGLSLPASPVRSTCWRTSSSDQYKPLPDFWWQNPAEHADHFAGPYVPRCLDDASLGFDRSYGLALRDGNAVFTYRRGTPVVLPGQRFGWFAFAIPLLDRQ